MPPFPAPSPSPAPLGAPAGRPKATADASLFHAELADRLGYRRSLAIRARSREDAEAAALAFCQAHRLTLAALLHAASAAQDSEA